MITSITSQTLQPLLRISLSLERLKALDPQLAKDIEFVINEANQREQQAVRLINERRRE